MPDTIPGDSSTTATVTVGSTTNGTLESNGDHDWYRLDLTAGQAVTININLGTLEDSYLRIRDSSGNILFQNDDVSAGVLRGSQYSFTASYTGTFYIDVGAWNDNYAGTYQLAVTPFSYDQFANYLTYGYWGGDTHHFNVTQGGSITVNLTALQTAAEQNLARAALAEWTDIIGVNFVEVSSGGQITFTDTPGTGGKIEAVTDATWSGGITSSAHINISQGWVNTYGTGLNTYSFQTYVHEIGHALGLGHAGDYNGSATYPADALFQNDSWATSIMSYFDQAENTYFAGFGFTHEFVETPMIADIVAMSTLYGLSTTTRTGDTTYGFNSNAGKAIYDATAYSNISVTIFDSGGTDTLDYSGYSTSQKIDLNPETFSNVGSGIGNLSIGRGTVIENAKGGSGNDTLTGNSVNNVLDGGAGSDSLSGGTGDDRLIGGSGTNTLDGGTGTDTADYSLAGASVSANLGSGIATISGGVASDTLISIENLWGSANGDTLVGSSAGNAIDGNAGNDSIDGAGGDDTLTGDSGADTLTGGAGNDTFLDTAAGLNGDRITDFAVGDKIVISDANPATFTYSLSGSTLTYSGGTLTFGSSLSGNLVASAAAGGGVQLILSADPTIYGTANDDFLVGTSGNDTLNALAGNDTINGLAGADSMIGGTGNDLFIVDNAGDVVVENAGEGTDTVQTSLGTGPDLASRIANAYLLPANVENLTGMLDTGQGLAGNSLDNVIMAGAGADYLAGNGGNDTLNGGAGADSMAGGTGNDIYYVDNAGDVVTENGGEGADTVFTTLGTGADLAARMANAYQLAANVENLTGTLDTGQGLAGDGLDNIITAGAGADYVSGGAGNDTLYGGAGTDSLDGGTGADSMVGGAGDDTYMVDNAGDVVTENAGEGTDTVLTSLGTGADLAARIANAYQLAGNVENLTGTLSSGQGLVGNGLANLINAGMGADFVSGGGGNDTIFGLAGDDSLNGDDGNDELRGQSGADTIHGGLGNDDMYGGPGNDLVDGGDGNDTVQAGGDDDQIYGGNGADELRGQFGVDTIYGEAGNDSVYGGPGNDSLHGGDDSDYLSGGGDNDQLFGENGNDTLQGDLGQDQLTGGAGADFFVYLRTSESIAGAADKIMDFVTGTDKIDLSVLDANSGTGGDQAFTFIGAAAFSHTAGELRAYDSGVSSWFVEGDVDGDGTADFQIEVVSASPLAGTDFFL